MLQNVSERNGTTRNRDAWLTRRLLAVLLAGLIAVLPGCAGVPSSSAPQAIGTVEMPSPKRVARPNRSMEP